MTTIAPLVAQAASAASSNAANLKAAGLSPMQAELLARADAIFEAVGASVSKATDMAIEGGKYVAKEVPEIAFQYVAYGRAMETLFIVLAFTFLIVAYHVSMKYGFKNTQNVKDMEEGMWGASRIVACCAGAGSFVIGFIMLCVNAKDFVLVWFAPKVWLLLELVRLIKIVKS